MDREWMVFNSNFFVEGNHRQHDRGIGNTEELQTFRTMLPRHRLSLMQPWFYSKCSPSSFPIFYMNSQSSLVHKYKYNLSIVDLLRMEVMVDEVWTPVKPELHRLHGVPPEGKMEAPVLWGNMAKTRDNEADWNRCNRKLIPIYAETIVSAGVEGLKCGQEASVKLESGGPVKAIFWGLRNKTAETYNIRSNYTSNLEDPVNGPSVAGHCSLEYRDTTKLSEMEPNHFEWPLLKYHLPSTPRCNGLYGYTFCHDVNAYGDNVAANLESLGAKFVIRLEDQDYYRWCNGNTDVRTGQTFVPVQSETIYSLVVRMLVMRKYTISSTGEVRRVY